MKDLTQGNETRTIITFALPMLVGNVFQQFYSMVDSIVVGRFVGREALAAVGISFPVLFLMISLLIGLTMGTSILISQYFGAQDHAKVRAAANTGYIILFWSGLAASIIGFLTTDLILGLLNVPAEVYAGAATYLRIIFAGMLTMFGYNAIAAILRGLGDSRTPLYLLIVASLVNVGLDLLFVAGFGWGIAGVAWATVIAQGLSFFIGIAYINKRNKLIRIDFKDLHFDRAIGLHSLRIGLPTGLQQTLVSLGMMALTRIVNGFGTATIAAYTAASRLDSFASMPAMNLGAAISTFTGQNMGAGKTDRVKRGHLSAVIAGAVISLAVGATVILFGRPLIGLFSTDLEVIAIGARYLLIVGASYTLFSTMFINNGVMRGAGDSFIPMINTLLALWVVRIPTALLFSGALGLGSDGLWLSIPAGWLMGAIFSTWYYLGGRWKRKAVVKGRPPAAG
ncbi:MAG: MATE family efflux transporter [Spirochaetes bacterium GWD1_61_31]|nr:MAG: MATE family efflux transporter [Spirochaetes bacterium GWB1_60_80]OHD30724.1 MAG: MATE family efflux transporter [Spirochaetes bacterium GWC1_61_12]OHD41356.1 MAG: MATE family efflux transporter [Spirochaetes bacterium GWD1_61_31]OHD42686.1 MAG: MATE family efflux transporter [Spirochaetes bacterium GWE1_60_18]OHD58561.1 MAG: MATE family efflux transporter [Spirochaetes bacterium GWF1_60_12]HAW85177.1 MATE family efflux transporter [Spirochaetaceae bacterium]